MLDSAFDKQLRDILMNPPPFQVYEIEIMIMRQRIRHQGKKSSGNLRT